MSQWQTVFKTKQAYQAEIVKSVLIDRDIPAVVINKQDSAYHLGYYEVAVAQEDVLNAMQIIENDINFK
jgi:hypothetical protein